jgi:hypothetical protein
MSLAAFVLAHLAFTTFLAVTAAALGRRLAALAGPALRAERWGLPLALGLGAIGSALALLAAAGRLTAPWLGILLAAAAAAAAREWRPLLAEVASLARRPRRGWALAALVAAAPSLALALYPPTGFDALLYHLPAAARFAASGRLTVAPELRFPAFPWLNELLFAAAMRLQDDVAAQLLECTAYLGAAALLWEMGRRRFGTWAGALGAALWLGSPLAAWEAASAYVEPLVALFLLAAVEALLLACETREPRALVLAGALAGCAAAVKYQGLFAIALVAVWVLRDAAPREPSTAAAPREPSAPAAPDEPSATGTSSGPFVPTARREPSTTALSRTPFAPATSGGPFAPTAPGEPSTTAAPREPSVAAGPLQPAVVSAAAPAARRGALSRRWRLLMFPLLAAAAVALPWYVWIGAATGDPLFPLLTRLGHPRAAGVPGPPPWHAWRTLPWRTLRQEIWPYPPGSPLLWLLAPLLLLGRRRFPVAARLGAAGLALVLVTAAIHPDARMISVAGPLFAGAIAAVLAPWSLARWGASGAAPRLLAVALLALLPGWCYTALLAARRGAIPVDPAGRESYLRRQLPGYGALSWLNSAHGRRYAVYGLWAENLRYYAAGRFLGDWYGAAPFAAAIRAAGRPADLSAFLVTAGADHLLVRRMPGQPDLIPCGDPRFVPFLHAEHCDGEASVWAVATPPRRGGS